MIDCTSFTLELRTRLHAEELFEVLSDASLYEYIDEEPPSSLSTLRQRLAATESGRSADGRHYWLNWVVRIASGQVAGFVQATIDPEKGTRVAYVLGKAFWGRQLAFRAVSEMLGVLAGRYGVSRVTVSIDSANRRSIELARRLGFVTLAGGNEAQLEVVLEKQLEKTS